MDVLINLDGGIDCCCCCKTPLARSYLAEIMCDPEIEKGLWFPRVSGATDHNIHKGLIVVLGQFFRALTKEDQPYP